MAQISCAVTAQLISAFVFATQKEQSIFLLRETQIVGFLMQGLISYLMNITLKSCPESEHTCDTSLIIRETPGNEP